jgi:exonuclease III
MSILCWNCRGLGNPRTVRDLCRLVKEKKPNLVFLIETKLRTDKLERIRIRIGFNSVFGVDSVGRSGGLALLWSDEISVEVQNYSRLHVNALVCLSSRHMMS